MVESKMHFQDDQYASCIQQARQNRAVYMAALWQKSVSIVWRRAGQWRRMRWGAKRTFLKKAR